MSLTKTCTKCGIEKGLDAFSRQAKGRFGVTSICRPCTSERGQVWYRENKERARERERAYAAANKERAAERARAWREANAERARARAAQWAERNKGLLRAKVARRRATKLQATPPWAEHEYIRSFYRMAEDVTRQSGVRAQVDHIVPLISDLVCGLHCAANLTLLTERANKSKGNRRWPDMP